MPPETSPEAAAASPAAQQDGKDESTNAASVAPPPQASPVLPSRPESLPSIASIVPPPATQSTTASASPALPTQSRPPQVPRQDGSHPASPMTPQMTQAPGPLFGMLKAHPGPANQHQHQPPATQPPPAHHQRVQAPHIATAISPERSHAELHDPSFLQQCDRLALCLQSVSTAAVRRVVRDNWQRCLVGSDYHTAFIMNASVHNARPASLQRAMRDFGETLLHATKVQVAGAMSRQLLDDVADILLSKAGPKFLDKAVAQRLYSIPAKTLLNSLARAERLGYDAGDIEEEDEPEPEPPLPPPPPPQPQQLQQQLQQQQHPSQPRPAQGAMPNQVHQPPQFQQIVNGQPPTPWHPPAQGQQPPQAQPAAQGQPPARPQLPPLAQKAMPNGKRNLPQCGDCGRIFKAPSAHSYHIKKRVCLKGEPEGKQGKGYYNRCPFCGMGFTSPMGLQYHTRHKVCGDFADGPSATTSPAAPPSTMPAQPPTTPAQPARSPKPLPNSAPMPPSSAPPAPAHSPLVQSDLPSQQPPAGPVANSTPKTPTVVTPYPTDNFNSSASRAAAHLSPEQKVRMDNEMKIAEDSFKLKIDEARRTWEPSSLDKRLASLKNSHATKQSQIRKKYGIRLRERRGPAAMAAERERLGLPAVATPIKPPPATPQGPPSAASTTPSSSQWTAANIPRPNGAKRPLEQDWSSSLPPIKKLAVSQLTGGLTGSSATAATQDPTTLAGPGAPRPHSSYGGSQPQRISMGIAGRGVSREEPVDVESSSDSGSDIPAE